MVEKSKNNMLKLSKKTKNSIYSRQQAPKVFEIVANIYCLKAKYLKKAKNLLEGSVLGYEVEQYKSYDVDTKYDLEIMKMFFKKLTK